MTGVGGNPRDYREFVVDTRKRLVSLERRQLRTGTSLVPTTQTATSDPPWFRASLTSTSGQTATSSASSPTWEVVSLHGGWTQAGTTFVAPMDGVVAVSANAGITFTSTTISNNFVAVSLNGTDLFKSTASNASEGSSGNQYYHTGGIIPVVTGDVIEMTVRTQVGGQPFATDDARTFFHGYYVSGQFDIVTDEAVIPPVTYAELGRTTTVAYSSGSTWTQDTALVDSVSTQGSITAESSQITIVQPGRYIVEAHLTFAGNATGNRNMAVFLNGAGVSNVQTGELWAGFSGNTNSGKISFTMNLAAGDVLTLGAWQSSGSDLNSSNARMAATLIQPAPSG